MGKIGRTLLMMAFIATLLAAWFGFGRAEYDLLRKLQDPPTVTLLTDQPELWRDLVRAHPSSPHFTLEIKSPQRSDWVHFFKSSFAKKEESLEKENFGECHFVSLKSYFVMEFKENGWLAPWPESHQDWWERLHVDFKGLQMDLTQQYFLPLLWAITEWRWQAYAKKDLGSQQTSYYLKTSPDEALLLAYDLNLPGPLETMAEDEGLEEEKEEDTEHPDISPLAHQMWLSLKPFVSFDFSHPVLSEVPQEKTPDHLRVTPAQLPFNHRRLEQIYKTFYEEEEGPSPSDQGFKKGSGDLKETKENKDDFRDQLGLWLIGLGLCPQHKLGSSDQDFLNWIFHPETQIALVKTSGLASTAMVAEHLKINEKQKPSSLRSFPLTRLRQRQIPWQMASLWPQIIQQVIQQKKTNKMSP